MSLLPDRSWEAIKLKAMVLGLARDQEEYRKSDEVRDRLRKNSEENMVEINYDKIGQVSYVMGVIDGDGFHDKKGTIGLEVKLKEFAKINLSDFWMR